MVHTKICILLFYTLRGTHIFHFFDYNIAFLVIISATSFTISGLSPDTKYYYTRQSLNETEVIDEETGSFETLSDAQEGTDNIGAERTNRKVIEDGNLYILHKEKKYSLDGNRID